MMKVHYIMYDNTLFIFGVVSDKRTGWDKKNIVCIRAYDMIKCEQVLYQGLTTMGMLNVELARKFWDKIIKMSNSTYLPLAVNHAIYKTMDGSEILTDTDISYAMDEIAWKQLTEVKV